MRLTKGDVEVALCDINMPDLTGIEVVREARTAGVDTTFIMMTAFSSVDTAIEAMKAGATDYMIKPLRSEELVQRLTQIADLRGLRGENEALRKLVVGRSDDRCPSVSPAMKQLDRLVAKVAPTDSTVLITGESGTGKGVTARAIHQQSQRASAPFIPVNCGAIPENLLESEFFGHTKGAFTGADRARKGLFLEADRGTIFLDEIGELPLELQVKLLHVLEAQRDPAAGQRAGAQDQRAHHRGDQPRPASRWSPTAASARTCTSASAASTSRCRRCASGARTFPALIRYLLARGGDRFGVGGKLSLDPEAEEILVATTGRATCASWKTCCSAPPSWPKTAASRWPTCRPTSRPSVAGRRADAGGQRPRACCASRCATSSTA